MTLRWGKVVHRNVDLVGLLVDEHGVAVGKGGTTHVLSTDTDIEALWKSKQ